MRFLSLQFEALTRRSPLDARAWLRQFLAGHLLVCTAWTQSVFINELHYDNAMSDAGEGVEIAGPAGTELSDYQLVLYNGNGGAVYDTVALSGTIPNENGSGFGAASFPITGIQNGSPDGIVLWRNSTASVIQFLSYEGEVTAAGGVADGMTSVDIGVEENGGTLATDSLQLRGSGSGYSDFNWTAPASQSFGSTNVGQTFTGGGIPGITLTLTPTRIGEDDGSAAIGTVTLSPAPISTVTIDLENSDPSEISIPSNLEISTTGSAQFVITALEDGVSDGDQAVSVTARDPGGNWTSSSQLITVADVDDLPGSGSAIRIASINLLNGVGSPGSAQYNAILKLLSRIRADIIACQEASGAGGFSNLKALASDLGLGVTREFFAVDDDAFVGQASVSGDFTSDQFVVLLSRFPITRTKQIGRGVLGRTEMTRYPLFVEVDVPGIPDSEDPALVVVHYKATQTEVSRFRKAVEAYRTVEYLTTEGYTGASDNLFVLGDFNEDIGNFQPASFSTAINTSTHIFGDGSTFPFSYQLGSDISGASAITIPYASFPATAFDGIDVEVLDTVQADGFSDRTFRTFGDARLDYIMASRKVLDNGTAHSEAFNSILDPVHDGLPKSGEALDPLTGIVASDHYPVFGDFELSPTLGSLSLSFSTSAVEESDPTALVTGTLSLTDPPGAGESLTVQLDPVRGGGVTCPPSAITFSAGETTATFTIRPLKDPCVNPNRRVTIAVSAEGYTSGYGTIQVNNTEPSGLALLSQYIETSSGSVPKAIELFNNSGARIDFEATPLVIRTFTGGSASGQVDAKLEQGTWPAGDVLVIGGSTSGQYLVDNGLLPDPGGPVSGFPNGTPMFSSGTDVAFLKDSFNFNGDDAIEVELGFTRSDVFGEIGMDPGSSWNGGGVSSANSNLSLRPDTATGTSGFSDPSLRWMITATGTDLTDFGIAPTLNDPYQSWANGFGLTGLLSAPGCDPDCDGIANLIEYATGSDPTTRSFEELPQESIVTSGVQNYLALTFRKLIDVGSLDYEVETSTDLQVWNRGTGFVTPIGNPVDNGDGTESVTFRSSLPASAVSARFLRLRVTKP